MEPNEILRENILQVVENQIKSNTPPETALTYKRLIKEGDDAENAKVRIAQCVAVEIFDVMKYGQEFNQKRYIKNLNRLPEEPFDEE